MPRNSTLLVALSFSFTIASPDPSVGFAQTLQWIRQFGSGTPYSVSADPLGNIFVSGATNDSLAGPFAGRWDAFFAKYDSNGTQLWKRQLGTNQGESAWGIAADGLGNVYVQGDTDGSLFDNNNGSFDIWLAKYDANGSLLWARQFGTSGVEEYGAVAANPLGGAYVSGRTTGSLGGPNGGSGDQFLARYGADGDLLWTRQISDPGNVNYSRLAADNLGNLYIAAGTVDSLYGPNAGGADATLAKYSSDGILLWSRQFGTAGDETANGGVSVDTFGNVFVLGDTSGNLAAPNAGDLDIFLTKFNANGTQLWTRQFGGPLLDSGSYSWGGGVAADGDGKVFLAASVDSTQSGGSAFPGDILIAKYDTDGNLIWDETIGTSESEGRARVAADGKGNVYFSGYTGGNLATPIPGSGGAIIGKFRDAIVPEPTSFSLTVFALLPLALSGARQLRGRDVRLTDRRSPSSSRNQP